MTNIEEHNQQLLARRDEIKRLIKKWVEPLGLKWWHINVQWETDKVEGTVPGYTTCFRVQATWKYLDAMIHVYLPACINIPDDRLEWHVVHELVHILLNEMAFWRDDILDHGLNEGVLGQHEERVATTIANAALWIRDFAQDGYWNKRSSKK